MRIIDGIRNGIFYRLWLPNTSGSRPALVIVSHGLGDNHAYDAEGFEYLAGLSYAVLAFDFRGGSAAINENRSEGDSLHMSVMTEARDLKEMALFAQRELADVVDVNKIALMGYSQGGFVTAVAAADLPGELSTDVKGLILLYPGFSLRDMVRGMFRDKADVPARFGLFDDFITVGRNYAEDVWDYDIYREIGHFTGPVLILHGDADDKVPLSYSSRALDAYRRAELRVIKGQGHGFGICRTPEIQNSISDFLLWKLF